MRRESLLFPSTESIALASLSWRCIVRHIRRPDELADDFITPHPADHRRFEQRALRDSLVNNLCRQLQGETHHDSRNETHTSPWAIDEVDKWKGKSAVCYLSYRCKLTPLTGADLYAVEDSDRILNKRRISVGKYLLVARDDRQSNAAVPTLPSKGSTTMVLGEHHGQCS